MSSERTGRLTSGWSTNDGERFTAEASDKPSPICPKAGYGRKIPKLPEHRDIEGEIVYWEGECACGASLIVFND
jgi:hypothetical protein